MSPREMTPEQAERAIRGVLMGIRDLRPFWPRVATWTRGRFSKQFKTEGSEAGTPWAALDPAYARWKDKHFPNRGILVASGKMRSALYGPTREATPDTLTLRYESEHAELIQFHDKGTRTRHFAAKALAGETKLGHVPARPILAVLPPPVGVSITAQNELDRIAEGYVDDMIRRWGLD